MESITLSVEAQKLNESKKAFLKKNCISFVPGTDICIGDILVNPDKEFYYVTDLKTEYIHTIPHCITATVQTEQQHKKHQVDVSTVYNIQNAYSSVIGNSNQTTISYGIAIDELKKSVSTSTSTDKAELEEIVNLLEKAINDKAPLQKGMLSRFSAVMERNSWITGSIASTILSWLLTKIQ